MAHGDAEFGALGFGASEGAVGPGDLLWGHIGRRGIPNKVEDVVLLEAVMVGEAASFDEAEVCVGLVAVPEFGGFLAVEDIEEFAVFIFVAGGIVVADGEGKG